MSENKIAIIYGSDTGITDYITTLLTNKLNLKNLDIIEVFTIKPIDFLKYDIILIGVPTWYVGDLQSDWEDFFPDFQKIDFNGIKVAFFGLGKVLTTVVVVTICIRAFARCWESSPPGILDPTCLNTQRPLKGSQR